MTPKKPYATGIEKGESIGSANVDRVLLHPFAMDRIARQSTHHSGM